MTTEWIETRTFDTRLVPSSHHCIASLVPTTTRAGRVTTITGRSELIVDIWRSFQRRHTHLESPSLAHLLSVMSLPSFPGDGDHHESPIPHISTSGSAGAGSDLPIWLLALCGAFTAVGMSFQHLIRFTFMSRRCSATIQ